MTPFKLESFGRVDFLFAYEDCTFFDVIFMVDDYCQ